MAPASSESGEPSEVVVYLKDGQRLTGILESLTKEQMRLRIGATRAATTADPARPADAGESESGGGVVTTLDMTLVSKYEVLPPINQRYLALREAVGNDPEQIVQLADWLRARERYELALIEIERALAIEPNLGPARTMKVQLEQQILLKLRARQEQPDLGNGASDPGKSPETGRPATRPPRAQVLTSEQINLIKVYETDLALRPRVVIPRDTITRLMEQNAGHPLVPITREGRETWYRKDPVEILDLMFRMQARNLYGQVQVLDQPEALIAFRDDVHRGWLTNRCATDQCHGGTEAGRLRLVNTRVNTDATLYTNFLILNRFKLASGESLISVDDAARSPLLQMGLPREDSRTPHPEVLRSTRPGAKARDAWRPVFSGVNDRAYLDSAKWIRLLYKPRPEYPIDYPVAPPPAASAAPGKPAPDTPAKPVPEPPSKPLK